MPKPFLQLRFTCIFFFSFVLLHGVSISIDLKTRIHPSQIRHEKTQQTHLSIPPSTPISALFKVSPVSPVSLLLNSSFSLSLHSIELTRFSSFLALLFFLFCFYWNENFRLPSEMGCVQSLLPFHSAVSSARLTSCLGIDSMNSRSLSQGTLCRSNPGV